jgi:predicted pyridoxine 5'-phosphate oxidase superfamily flavin-nucleotide-binding protein
MVALTSTWHAGERAVQQRVGEAHLADRATGAIRTAVPPVAAEFLAQQHMLAVAAVAEDGLVWASVLTGSPGFLTVPRDDVLDIAARPAAGDPLATVLARPASVGTLAIEPATRRRSRLNGRSTPTPDGLHVQLDQVFANCPKYIQQREVVALRPAEGDGGGRLDAQVGDRLSAHHRRWIERADTFFIGTTDGEGGVDASHRGGNPGFVQVVGPDRFRFPDYRGNSMYMTLGNLQLQPAAGFVFVDWDTGAALQVSGRAVVHFDVPEEARMPGALRVIDVVVTRVVEVPRAVPLVWGEATPSRFNPDVA